MLVRHISGFVKFNAYVINLTFRDHYMLSQLAFIVWWFYKSTLCHKFHIDNKSPRHTQWLLLIQFSVLVSLLNGRLRRDNWTKESVQFLFFLSPQQYKTWSQLARAIQLEEELHQVVPTPLGESVLLA